MRITLYTNQSADATGDLKIINSVYPEFVPSATVTIPSNQLFPDKNHNILTTYYSSLVNTSEKNLHTLQLSLVNYTGTIQIIGSNTEFGDFYNIDSLYTFDNVSTTVGYTINGFNKFIKLKFTSTGGNVTSVLHR
jgi:hypothetical protein